MRFIIIIIIGCVKIMWLIDWFIGFFLKWCCCSILSSCIINNFFSSIIFFLYLIYFFWICLTATNGNLFPARERRTFYVLLTIIKVIKIKREWRRSRRRRRNVTQKKSDSREKEVLRRQRMPMNREDFFGDHRVRLRKHKQIEPQVPGSKVPAVDGYLRFPRDRVA